MWGCKDVRFGGPHIGQRQLDIGFAVVLVLIEGERDVERRLVLSEEVVSLGCAPGDRAENPALLFERHLQVALFQLSWTVDDFDTAGSEYRARVAGAERRQRRHSGCDAAGDAAERKVTVDPQARHQVVWAERL